MALQATFTHKGKEYVNSYSRIHCIRDFNRAKKIANIDIAIYSSVEFRNSTAAGEGIDNFLFMNSISILPDDFDTYFGGTNYTNGELYQEKNVYEFLKNASLTNYPNLMVDYTNAIYV